MLRNLWNVSAFWRVVCLVLCVLLKYDTRPISGKLKKCGKFRNVEEFVKRFSFFDGLCVLFCPPTLSLACISVSTFTHTHQTLFTAVLLQHCFVICIYTIVWPHHYTLLNSYKTTATSRIVYSLQQCDLTICPGSNLHWRQNNAVLYVL